MPPLLAKLNRPIVAILTVGAIAGVLRFTHLGYPQERVFDEYYYSKSACILLGYSNARCQIQSDDERFWREDQNDTGAWVHPPLGKWMIAAGELAVGTGSYGWRVSAAITGTASVMLLAFIVHLLFASPIWTFAGGLLLAVESLNFVQSRTAMLDIFVTFWIVLGFALLLLDRRWIERRTARAGDDPEAGTDEAEPPPDAALPAPPDAALPAAPDAEDAAGDRDPHVPAPIWRPWRIAAGAALGAGFATKWSALTAIAVAVLLSFAWDVARRRRAGLARPLTNAIPVEGFGLVVSFLLVPAIVYVVSYAGWFGFYGLDLGRWGQLQQSMFDYHRNLQVIDEATGKPAHPYLSEAWRWIFLYRPVLYFADYGDGIRRVIYATGNPAIFWGSLLAVPYAAVAWARSRDWRAGFVVVTIAGLYLPWLLVPRPQFLFYATPITPFLVLACVFALKHLSEIRLHALRSTAGRPRSVRPYLPVAVAFVAVAVGLFAWFWPVLTGGPLSDADWAGRAWFPSWT
ncbi:MAG: phospholipid carrier-dependent glycosyltransferase [Actinomycetota bacterium]